MLRRECPSRRRHRHLPRVLVVVSIAVMGVAHWLIDDHQPARVRLAKLAVRTIAADRDLPRAPIIDPWGTPYRLYHTRAGLAVVSAGPDRIEHTSDDVTSY